MSVINSVAFALDLMTSFR